ncbi:MAG: hypothetical protein JJE19_04405, partial [Methanosarcinales archaeon]|nr:hypothetical protein [Methanosarcinales archaeon]
MRVKDRIPEKGELKVLFERGLKLGQVADQLGMDSPKISYWKTKYGLTRQGSEVEEWINEHPDVKRAFASMGKNSKRVYYTHLRKYCFWCDKEPEELWEEDKKIAQDRV